jgi:hypothetical protein
LIVFLLYISSLFYLPIHFFSLILAARLPNFVMLVEFYLLTAKPMNITAFRLWRRAVWSKYSSILETVVDAMNGIFCFENEGMDFSETWSSTSQHVRASQRTVISFLPLSLYLCLFCLQLRWPLSAGDLSSLEWFPHVSCTDAAVGVSFLLWCPYTLSSRVLCIRRLEIRPRPDLSHFRWYWSNKRSCDNRFVSQIASFTLCSCPLYACGVT